MKKAVRNGQIMVAITITILANAAGIIVPVFLPALAHTRGLTEAQGGLFALAEYGGVGIGAMACALLPGLVERLNWRRTAALGLVGLIAANLAMATPMGFLGLFILALAAGLGAGLVNAVFYAICAEGAGARLVAAFTAAQIGVGAAGIGLVSPIVERHGEAGAFLTLAAIGGIALLLCPLLPARGLAQPEDRDVAPEPDRISGVGWAAIVGLFIYFIGQGASYGFIGYMGLAWGGKPHAVESAVSGIMVVGMFGALIVMLVGSRFGYVRPLALAMLGSALGLVLFIVVKPVAAFLPIGGLLYFSGNIVTPYLFDVLTDADKSSGAAMMMGASQLGGFALGPAIAGYLVTPDYTRVNGFIFVLFIAASLIVLGVVSMSRRRARHIHINIPARAEG